MNFLSTPSLGIRYRSYHSYLIGLILSIILTVIPFCMVMQQLASESMLITILVICAILQIIVHLVYFLRMNTSSEQQWNLIALMFSVIIIAILVVGSLWIMWYLHHNLMGRE